MEEIFTLNLGRLVFVCIVFFLYFLFSLKTKKWFFYSTLFLIALLPFNITLQQPNFDIYIHGLSSNYIIPTIHLIDVFVFFLLVSAFKERKKLKINKNTKVFFLILFLFFTTKVILDWSLLSTILIYRIFFYSFACFTIFNLFPFKKHIKTLSIILLFSILIQFVIGILQFKFGHSLGLVFLGESQVVKGMFGSSFVDLNGTLFLRAYGTFPHPNVFAAYLFFVTFFCISFFKEKINILTAILATILIFFTFSRITIVLVFFLWIIFFFKKFFSKQKLFSLYPLFFTRFVNLFSERDSSFFDRFELMKTAKEIIQTHPYFGIGAGKFVYGLDYYPVYTAGGFLLLQPVHNIFLLILSEWGFVFGIPLVLFILFVLLKSFFKGNWLIKYLIFAILVFASFDHYFVTLPQGVLMFAVLLTFLFLISSNGLYLKKVKTFF